MKRLRKRQNQQIAEKYESKNLRKSDIYIYIYIYIYRQSREIEVHEDYI
jgi:hypothetical protein